jgi:hypothetical protein
VQTVHPEEVTMSELIKADDDERRPNGGYQKVVLHSKSETRVGGLRLVCACMKWHIEIATVVTRRIGVVHLNELPCQ